MGFSGKTYKAMKVRDGNKSSVEKRGTARSDTVEKIIKNGWVNGAVCNGRYTDDYKRDLANDFDKGSVSKDHLLKELTQDPTPKHCWVHLKSDGSQHITLYWSFQSYTFEIDTRHVRFEF